MLWKIKDIEFYEFKPHLLTRKLPSDHCQTTKAGLRPPIFKDLRK